MLLYFHVGSLSCPDISLVQHTLSAAALPLDVLCEHKLSCFESLKKKLLNKLSYQKQPSPGGALPG